MNIVKSILAFIFVVFFVFQVMAATDKAKESKDMNAQSGLDAPIAADIKAEVIPYTGNTNAVEAVVEKSKDQILEAVKAVIKERSKSTGTLDLYDSKIEKVRNLDLMELQPAIAQSGGDQVVTGDFRDTKTGDVVTLEITAALMDGAYKIKDTVITGAKAPQAVKEEAKDLTDEDILNFMKEYIDTQAQTTGTFDLYDEKIQKMRNLEFMQLDAKLRRFGVIAISTAVFKDKNSGDIVRVDVNTENKSGLSVTAMRIKDVKKASVEAAQ